MAFKAATRKGTFTLIGLTGHSGTGKTNTALLIARGLVGPSGKIAGIDTENGRMSHFQGITPFDVDDLYAPFTPARYKEKVREAEAAGYHCLIIDSFSHEWEGTGGVLELADAQTTSAGRAMQGLNKWAKPKAEHKKLVNTILQSKMHIIICMRGKDKLVQTKDENGKEVIVNQGVVPIQDGRFNYEMTISAVLRENDSPLILRCPPDLMGLFQDRSSLTHGRYLNQRHGEAVAEWVNGGERVNINIEQLVKRSRVASEEGVAAYREFFIALTKPEQAALVGEFHEANKKAAEAVDAANLAGGDDTFPGDR